MKLNVVLLASLFVVGALGDKEKVTKLEAKSKSEAKPKRETPTEPKPKREATISGGSSYHGPSYKYLPPNAGGFDSYSSSHHSSAGGVGGYSLGSSGFGGGHSVGGGHSLGGGHYGSSAPKVETYIVQTETAHDDHGYAGSHGSQGSHGLGGLHGFSVSSGFGGSHGLSSSLGGAGYRYAGPSASFGGGFGSHQSSFGSSHSHSHGPVHKIKAIVIPTNSFSGAQHGGGGYTRFGGHGGGGGGGAGAGGYSYSKGIGGGSYHSNEIGGGGYATHHSAGGYTGGHSSGAGFSNVQGSHGYEQGYDVPAQSIEASYRDTDHIGGQGGYSYETPSSSYAHGQGHSTPSSSYGAPNIILSPPYQGGETASSYAVGQKGLGHFGYAASRPQVLHTNFIDSSSYGGSSYASHGQGARSYSKAPFKPSLFLGASHEGSSSLSSGGSISSEYGPPAGGQGISSQYLPPTSDGYDYPSPSTGYGAPTESHGHDGASGSVYEPENSYLPPTAPQTSYGPPATPGDSYLPPHH